MWDRHHTNQGCHLTGFGQTQGRADRQRATLGAARRVQCTKRKGQDHEQHSHRY